MEMHQLRYVVAVARAGNFSRAAEQCHVSHFVFHLYISLKS